MREDVEHDVELLGRVVAVADVVLAPRPNVSVPADTVQTLRDTVMRRRAQTCLNEDCVVGDEAWMLAQAMVNTVLHRLDGNVERAVRWRMILQHLLPWVRTDLAVHMADREARNVRGG